MVQNCSIEYLPKIRQLVILIPISVENIESNTKLYINKFEKILHTDDSNTQNSQILISVPGSIPLEKLFLPLEAIENFPQVNRVDDVLILQFRNVTHSNNLAVLNKLQTSKSLQGNCQEFVCSNCLESLRNFDKSGTFYDLPNEHWLELLDCWSCHDNEFAPIAERALNQKIHGHSHDYCGNGHHSQGDHKLCSSKSYHDINNSSHGLILPPVGRIYLGSSFILMHLDDFSLEICSSCNAIIGEKVQGSHIKLYRDSIKFKLNDSSICLQESFTSILMHRILDTIDNHSTFHFILKTTDNDRLYLRPINWNLQVFDFNTQNWRTAFKLGFAELAEAPNTEAEVISCTPNQFKQIKDQIYFSHKSNLFSSSLKYPGIESSLKLSYLIN